MHLLHLQQLLKGKILMESKKPELKKETITVLPSPLFQYRRLLTMNFITLKQFRSLKAGHKTEINRQAYENELELYIKE